MGASPRRVRRRGLVRAVGEVVLIVAGVLIALGLDNWNARRGEAHLEVEYLERVADDLRADTTTIALMLELLDRKQESLARVAAALASEAGMSDTAGLLHDVVQGSHFAWAHPPTRRVTFRELESTGNLRLIRDAKLRAEIVAYYYLAEHEEERIGRRRTGYGPLTLALVPRGASDFEVADLSGAQRARVLERVRESALLEMVAAEQNFAAIFGRYQQEQRDRAVALLDRLGPSPARAGATQ